MHLFGTDRHGMREPSVKLFVGHMRQRQVLVAGPDLSERLHLGAHLVFT